MKHKPSRQCIHLFTVSNLVSLAIILPVSLYSNCSFAQQTAANFRKEIPLIDSILNRIDTLRNHFESVNFVVSNAPKNGFPQKENKKSISKDLANARKSAGKLRNYLERYQNGSRVKRNQLFSIQRLRRFERPDKYKRKIESILSDLINRENYSEYLYADSVYRIIHKGYGQSMYSEGMQEEIIKLWEAFRKYFDNWARVYDSLPLDSTVVKVSTIPPDNKEVKSSIGIKKDNESRGIVKPDTSKNAIVEDSKKNTEEKDKAGGEFSQEKKDTKKTNEKTLGKESNPAGESVSKRKEAGQQSGIYTRNDSAKYKMVVDGLKHERDSLNNELKMYNSLHQTGGGLLQKILNELLDSNGEKSATITGLFGKSVKDEPVFEAWQFVVGTVVLGSLLFACYWFLFMRAKGKPEKVICKVVELKEGHVYALVVLNPDVWNPKTPEDDKDFDLLVFQTRKYEKVLLDKFGSKLGPGFIFEIHTITGKGSRCFHFHKTDSMNEEYFWEPLVEAKEVIERFKKLHDNEQQDNI